MKLMKVMSVFGTRPEAVKMCPLVKELKTRSNMENIVCITGQHHDMVYPVLRLFGIEPDIDLDIMRPQQTLTTITTDVLTCMEEVLVQNRPDIVLVHGDTTTSFAAALAAFYQKITVGHVEAGLRTYDRYSPFPEEMNRNLTGKLAQLHFAPTEKNKMNLEAEGIRGRIYITGNTVIDAFKTTLCDNYVFHNNKLNDPGLSAGRIILLTAHRRENLGEPLEHICHSVKRVAETFPECRIIYPLHLNPAVRKTAGRILGSVPNVILTEPLDVQDMHNLIARSYLVMTDSGGLQEEAPSCGIPVLVLRSETERPEAVEAGTVKIVGTEEYGIYCSVCRLLTDSEEYHRMARAVNPYGDGLASRRIADILNVWEKEGFG